VGVGGWVVGGWVAGVGDGWVGGGTVRRRDGEDRRKLQTAK